MAALLAAKVLQESNNNITPLPFFVFRFPERFLRNVFDVFTLFQMATKM